MKRTHCEHGHEIAEVVVNRYGKTSRFCRTCKLTRQREQWLAVGPDIKQARNANARRAREDKKASLPPRELWQGRKEFCLHGHRLNVKNTRVYMRTRDGKTFVQRQCRICLSVYDRRRHQERKVDANGGMRDVERN